MRRVRQLLCLVGLLLPSAAAAAAAQQPDQQVAEVSTGLVASHQPRWVEPPRGGAASTRASSVTACARACSSSCLHTHTLAAAPPASPACVRDPCATLAGRRTCCW